MSKLKAVTNEGVKFSAIQINGLMKGFRAIRSSNLVNSVTKEEQARGIDRPVVKLPAKVDYWLDRNEDALNRGFKDFNAKAEKILDQYVKQKEVNGIKFVVYQGKDENDIVLQDRNNVVVREIVKVGEEKPELEIVQPQVVENLKGYYWDEIIEEAVPEVPAVPAQHEGEEDFIAAQEAIPAKPAVIKKHLYQKLFLNEGDENLYNEAMEKAETEEVYEIKLYKLAAENLDGISVSWPNPGDPRVSLDQFRSLIFEHCIVD